jgi:tripartite motif-containing protein 71
MDSMKLMHMDIAPIFVAFVLVVIFTAGAGAQEEYTFVAMWPELPQPWYFDDPYGIAVDSSGNLYVADTFNNRVQKFDPDGKFITNWGGKGTGDGEFDMPYGIAADIGGNLYVADAGNGRIQKFDTNGKFITKWGSEGTGEGEFMEPYGVAVDSSGNLYVTDTFNNRIQKFDPDGKFITNWGGKGTGDGEFDMPYGIAADSGGNLYVADAGNGKIQKFDTNGKYITKWGSKGTGEGDFMEPYGIAVDIGGNVYVTDTFNNRIQNFNSNGKFITSWGSYGTGEGDFKGPHGIAVDSGCNVYVADTHNSRIQKFNSNGNFITSWGSYGTVDGEFNAPYGMAIDSGGNVYVSDSDNDRIQKFNSDGGFITLWGKSGSSDGEFDEPFGIAMDGGGNVYVVDAGNSRIQKFDTDGKFITKWGSYGTGESEFNRPQGIAVDSSGNLYVADSGNDQIQKFDTDGKFITKWGESGTKDGVFDSPRGIAADGRGNVYVVDAGNSRIQKFDTNGKFITKWGSYGTGEGEFNWPQDIAVDDRGNVYVADAGNNRIQKFDTDGNFITNCGSFGSGDGEFSNPCGISVDGGGNVFVADTHNNRIQKFKIYHTGGKGVAAQINAGADDGFVARSTDFFHTGSTDITIGTAKEFSAFLRFSTVNIPEKATIAKAYITVVPTATNPAGLKVNISAADVANPSTPTTYSDFYARKRTASSVTWDASSWTAGESVNSTDISMVIQELEDSYVYFAGAPILLFFDSVDQGAAETAQYFAAFENAEYESPKLYIVYYSKGRNGVGNNQSVVTIISPVENVTYETTTVDLTYIVNEPRRWVGYSLDEAEIITISGNITLEKLKDGLHNLTIYAEDMKGTIRSDTVSFEVYAVIPTITNVKVSQTYVVPGNSIHIAVDVFDSSGVSWVRAFVTKEGKDIWTIPLSPSETEADVYTGTWHTLIFEKCGIYNISIHAMDTEGNEALAKPCQVEILNDTEAPKIVNVTVDPTITEPGTPIHISADVFDELSGVLDVKCIVSKDGEEVTTVHMLDLDKDCTYNGTWRTMIFLAGGIYDITVIATDNRGNEASAKADVFIVGASSDL